MACDSSHEDQQIIIMDRKTKKEKVVHWRELLAADQFRLSQTTMPSPADSNTFSTTQSANQSKLDAPYDKLPLKLQHMRLWAMAQPRYDAARSSETLSKS